PEIYSRAAAQLLFSRIYKSALGADKIDFTRLAEQHREAFAVYLRQAVAAERLDPRLLDFDLTKLTAALRLERDDLFQYLGAATLANRYLIRDVVTKKIWETPQFFWLRVAMGVALAETADQRTDKAIEFYNIISTLHFLPSSPTLFHAGTLLPQCSSCYLTFIDDSLDHIFKAIGDNAQLSKWAGGVANDWSSLRGVGALIKGTGVASQGVVPFLKIANDTTVAINRSGRRRGATCAYMETWHYDIEDFLELKKNTGDERRRTHDMNTANWVPDLFMKRVRDNGPWTLFSPEETPELHETYGAKFDALYQNYEKKAAAGELRLHKTLRARDLWKKMVTMLFETGHPWITFKDPCNVRSPQDHVGIVHSSNLCTEITLNTSRQETAVCNLGSINLPEHLTATGQLDLPRLEATVKIAMRMLDNVIDINFYPTPEGQTANWRHRPVGLGLMGFQDALYRQNINFNSAACLDFADQSGEALAYYALLASTELARERGAYETFPGSKWDRGILPLDTLDLLEKERGEKIDLPRTGKLDWQIVRQAIKTHGLRNSNCLAIAPTATIANIAGVFPSIEPIYKNAYVKSNIDGEFTIINQYLVADLKKLGLWNQALANELKGRDGSIAEIEIIPVAIRQKYQETFDIAPEWLIRAAARRGKWLDQSQSLNLFVRNTSGKEITEMYLLAWSLGLKTTYYLRSLGASAVEKSTLGLHQQATRRDSVASQPKAEPAAPVVSFCKLDDPTCEACQ
ncbi:MAG: ribonucleoside-diphosphate reductase subunit alpha, partial [Patescibacteria group bacterium]